MKYKLIALDLDGTLLNNSGVISEYTRHILKKITDMGVYIVIATGRSYTSLKPKIHSLKLEFPIICYNGAMIRDGKSDEVISSYIVPENVSRAMINYSRSNNIHLHGFINGEFYYESDSSESKYYQELSGLGGIKTNFDSIKELNFTKCMFIGNNEKLLNIESIIRPLYGDKSYIAFSKPTFLEIMNIEASKSKALAYLADRYGIIKEEIIAFGDGLNDQDMLEFAGKGIVMKNGYDSLKKIYENSDYTNDEDGVAKYLEKIINE